MSAQMTLPIYEQKRLGKQRDAVLFTMLGGDWWTDAELVARLRCAHNIAVSEGGVGARRRDLRKREYGSHEIESREREPHLFEYRLVR